MAKRSLHARLQEYCDCFVEADLGTELEKFVGGHREAPDADETEAALKALAISLLTAIERRAERISIRGARMVLQGDGRGLLTTLPPDILGRIVEVVQKISGTGDEKESGRISLGLRGGEVLLQVDTRRGEEGKEVVIGF